MATYGNHQTGSRMYRVIRNTTAIPAQMQIVGIHSPIAIPLAIGDIVIGRPTFQTTPFGTSMKVIFILPGGGPYEIRDGFEDITPVKSTHEINKVPGTKTVFKKDTGIDGIGTKVEKNKTFEYLGAVVGIAYGLYFAKDNKGLFSNKYLNYFFWALIFGLAVHEIGEQIDRYVMPAIKKQFA